VTAFVLFKYLHILTMFAAVAAAMIPEIVLHAVARRGDVAGVRALVPVVGALGRLIPILFMVGLVFGLIAAVTGELDLLRPWLIASYVVFAIAMATGALLSDPWARRVADAALASPTDVYSPELEAAVHDRRGVISTAILMSAIVVIVFLMVAKPGG
jgi:hypothetical protein